MIFTNSNLIDISAAFFPAALVYHRNAPSPTYISLTFIFSPYIRTAGPQNSSANLFSSLGGILYCRRFFTVSFKFIVVGSIL